MNAVPQATPIAGASPTVSLDAWPEQRRRNWIAIGLATVPMLLSTLSYAAAFIDDDNGTAFRPEFAGLALGIAPLALVLLGFGSRGMGAPRYVLRAMLVLVLASLAIGNVSPLLGTAIAFAAAAAICLRRPDVAGGHRWRIAAGAALAVYVLVLLAVVTPGGVLAAALLPFAAIGLADEYAVWAANRGATTTEQS